MARLGHASPAAAQRYQHAAQRRDAAIASALDVVLEGLPAQKSAGIRDGLGDAPRGWRGVGGQNTIANQPPTASD
jgi:hypothetical protein